MSIDRIKVRQAGITLVEQIVFIVIVSVGIAGVLSTLGPILKGSADPQVRKQQLAIAESLLSEIIHQPFTYCDPDDPAAVSATSTASCTTSQDSITGPSPGTESRTGASAGTIYDNVADYSTFSQANITDITGGNAMAGYTATVTMARIGASYTDQNTGAGMSAGAALQINVTVMGGANDPLTLTGYRFRYAPRY